MGSLSLLLVHSPLVGPSSLGRLAAAARTAGHEVALPDLTSVATVERPQAVYVQLAAGAAATMTGPITVVGHSGAGAFLPAIGEAIEDLGGLVFVDAVVPPPDEPHRTPDGLARLLDEHTSDGRLERWLDWWPAEVVTRLLPDPTDRNELVADMPRLPRAFYDVDVDVPDGWSAGPCAYLRLSAAYDAEHDDARSRGWPTLELDSTHLATHTAPDEVLRSIVELASRVT